jgi:hypothetical protein
MLITPNSDISHFACVGLGIAEELKELSGIPYWKIAVAILEGILDLCDGDDKNKLVAMPVLLYPD